MSKYIDAELLKKILKPIEWGTPDERWVPEHEIGAMLDYFPAADVAEVRHGRMVIEPDATVMHCNVCGWAYQYYAGLEEEWNYCPNCGAKMRSIDDEVADLPMAAYYDKDWKMDEVSE